mmetsp:Transcript_21764/g.24200  ORF Transcript_21764/g.24200 Transcript_21764/m.24200 type:complete len:126 (+) Transcript_21764:409-786(+)
MFLSRQVLKPSIAKGLTLIPRVSIITSSHFNFTDKERGEERVYFSMKEKNCMKSIIAKLDAKVEANREKFNHQFDEDHYFVPSKERRLMAENRQLDENLVKIFHDFGLKEDQSLMKSLNDWKCQK